MTNDEWTSVPLKESQKQQLASDKPDGMTWGYYLLNVRQINDGMKALAQASNEVEENE